VEQGTDAMENLVKKLSNTEEQKSECKKLEKELEEARVLSNRRTLKNGARIMEPEGQRV
nr:hypothetical protein [Tanacetum cinerariifolium]